MRRTIYARGNALMYLAICAAILELDPEKVRDLLRDKSDGKLLVDSFDVQLKNVLRIDNDDN